MSSNYWLSYTSYDSPCLSYHCDGFMISVVLDAGTKTCFTGIRIVISYEESEMFQDIRIRECLQTERHGLETIASDRLSNRQMIAAHRVTHAQEHRKAKPLSGCSSILTISLQVVGCSVIHELDYDEPLASLAPRTSDTSARRIAYDETFFPDSGSILKIFESNLCFRIPNIPLPSPSQTTFRLHYPCEGLPTFSSRILPVARNSGSKFDRPPRSVLWSIAEAATDTHIKGWRSDLLSIGLVCKAWSGVLDAFFAILTGESPYVRVDPPNPLAVARSLEMRPERGLFLQCFHLEDYLDLTKGIDNDEQFITRCRAVLSILFCATAITDIHLPGIHVSLRKEFQNILSGLVNIQRCTIYDRDSHMGKNVDFNIGEIQQFMTNWTKLRHLDIAFRTVVSTSAFDDQVPALHCSLETIKLRTSHLTGRQFVRFASSNLQKVELERLNGPTNQDLLSFLSVASRSLRNLKITNCPFRRHAMNEEYAIDAVMHKLRSLEELYVSGDLLTPLSIARKRRRDGSPASSTFMATIVPGICLEGVIEALEVSEWNVVSIKTLPGFVDGDELLLKERALKVAARRGIALMYQPVF